MTDSTPEDLVTPELISVRRAHQFQTRTTSSRIGVNTHHAGCTCDPDLTFAWDERAFLHARHVERMIAMRVVALQARAFNEGYDAAERDDRRQRACPGTSGCDCTVLTTNPYDTED